MKPQQLKKNKKNKLPPNTRQLARDEPQATAEMTRKIQSEDLSLEVVHPDAAGIDIGNESHYVAVPRHRTANPYAASDVLRRN